MARNEDGEFELVLGNRQLLSLAAIVVILFGIFFTMGYIVGRNSTPFSQTGPDGSENAPAATDRRPDPGGAPVLPERAPAANEPAPDATQPAQPPPEVERAPERTPEPATAATAAAVPEAGRTYLQVTAIARRDAEILVEALKKKGFPALIGEAPKGLFRVLVGPYDDRTSLGKAKSDLEAAGFKNAFVQRL